AHDTGTSPATRIPPQPRPADIPPLRAPASYNQEALWALHRSAAEPGAYNIAHGFEFDAALDVPRLIQVLGSLTRRHESLRTVFAVDANAVLQVVQPQMDWPVERVPLPDDGEPWAHPELQRAARAPFDLARGPLVRAVVGQSETHTYLLLVFHHSIVDGWSLRILYRELGALYSRPASPLDAPSTIQPVDFAHWQRAPERASNWRAGHAFWQEAFTPPLEPLAIPGDRHAAGGEAQVGDMIQHVLDPTLVTAAQAFAAREGITMFMLLLSAYATLLYRHTGQARFAIGIPSVGRPDESLTDTVGYFINSLPLVLSFSADDTLHEQVHRIADACVAAYAHADMPTACIRECLPDAARKAGPMFNTLFILQDLATRSLTCDGHSAQGRTLHNHTAKYPFSILAYPESEGLILHAEFGRGHMSPAMAERLLLQFENVLRTITTAPDTTVCKAPLADAAEMARVAEWSFRPADYPRDATVSAVFLEQARTTPDRIALSCGETRLTYAELERQARQVAASLLRQDMPRHAHVGITGKRSAGRIVHTLGVLLAGGVYVPLDALSPPERQRGIVEDGNLWGVLGLTAAHVDWLPGHVRRLYVDNDDSSACDPLPDVAPMSPAYLMYTSGSTGVPKGSLIPHRAILRLVCNNDYVPLNRDTVTLQLASLAFDAATLEIWGPLLNGGRLAIPSPGNLSPRDIGEALTAEAVNTLWLTAGLLHVIVDEALDALAPLTYLLAGGDVLSVPHIRRLRERFPELMLVNGYGPTENTTFTCCHTIAEPPPEGEAIPIGRPIRNTRIAVMDPWKQPCGIGMTGELWASGDGLSLGYWNSPERNAQSFVETPGGERWYRIGDMVRWREDGALDFLGRRDTQVKIRGFRVELDAIREALRRDPHVQDATVRPWAFASGDQILTAYVIPCDGAEIDSVQVQRALHHILPSHEVPAFVIALDAFPLNINGKVDLRALPSPEGDVRAADARSEPQNERERIVANLFSDVFAGHPVGRHSDFFNLGGDSLTAARVIARLEQEVDYPLSLNLLYWNPTVAGLAEAIGASQPDGKETGFVVPLRASGSRPPLYFVHGIRGDVFNFQELSQALPDDQPVFGIRQSPDDIAPETTTVAELAALYADAILNHQPDGPYALGGYSIGGMLAHAIAAELSARGASISVLAIFDTKPPNLPHGVHMRMLVPHLWRRMFAHAGRLVTGNVAGGRSAFVMGRLRALGRHLNGSHSRAHADAYDTADTHTPPAFAEGDPFRAIVLRHTPRPYPGTAHLFKAKHTHYGLRSAWRYLAQGGVHMSTVPGHHLTIMSPKHLDALSKALNLVLEKHLK
ncbi:MAG: amino acid adenylation domain-containing protein, partial [Verrucomicrobia bacterium]|nr:amino acid adenylation domain-containing protein [Verrucomicrobiota bacterium]